MIKAILCLALCISIQFSAHAQTTATDFTAIDCNGVPHNLFSELDNGQIVVLVWVMPCIGCVSDAIAARDAVKSFAQSHPGKVVMYMADDDGGTNCGLLTSWSSDNGIGGTMDGNIVFFENTGNSINQANYGGMGMPHIVVMGGSDHKIYYNVLNGFNNEIPIRNAISQALGIPASISNMPGELRDFRVFPAQSGNSIGLHYSLVKQGRVVVDIINVNGVTAQTFSAYQPSGEQTLTIELGDEVSNGYYIIRLNKNGHSKSRGFTIAR